MKVDSMLDRLSDGPAREKILELGLSTEQGIEEMSLDIQKWMEIEYATLGLVQGEMIIHK